MEKTALYNGLWFKAYTACYKIESHPFTVLSPNLIIHSHSPRSIQLLQKLNRYVKYSCDRYQHPSMFQFSNDGTNICSSYKDSVLLLVCYFGRKSFYHYGSHKHVYSNYIFGNWRKKHRMYVWTNWSHPKLRSHLSPTNNSSQCETQYHFGSLVISINSEAMSISTWKVWIFLFFQGTATLANGWRYLWTRPGDLWCAHAAMLQDDSLGKEASHSIKGLYICELA